MYDQRFDRIVQYLRARTKMDSLTDMQLLHYCEAEIASSLNLCWNTHLHDVYCSIRSYTTEFIWHMPDKKSNQIQFECKMFLGQLLRDYPPQKMNYGTPGIGKTTLVLNFPEPEDKELN